MNFTGKNISKRVLLHAVFWLTWVISFTIVQSLGYGIHQYFVWLVYYVVTLPVFMVHTYLIAYVLLPLVRDRGNYFLFFLGIVIFLPVFSVIELVVSNELVFKSFDIDKSFSPGYLNLKNILVSGVGNHYIILVFFAIKAGRSWYSSQNRKDELLQLKMETELEIYHYQLQPRVVLTLMEELEEVTKHDDKKSPEMIEKISGFLSYFLFEGGEELIPLQQEVRMIGEFLEIHKYALGDRLKSNFIADGNLNPFVVPPFLLLPFLNDAIKLVYECNEPFESAVLIKGGKKKLLYSFTFWSRKEFGLKDDENMETTKKRLNYTFPGKFRLVETIDENFREISLEIFH